MRKHRVGTWACGAMAMGLLAGLSGCASGGGNGQAAAVAPSAIGEPERLAILAALEDERKSEDFYEAVLAEYGRRQPMMMLANQERCHQRWLHSLASRHGVELPDRSSHEFDEFASFEDACRAGAEAERENVALYDRLLAETNDTDVRSTFERLRWVSLERHLPALERAAGDAS